jgi:hypothetical protein
MVSPSVVMVPAVSRKRRWRGVGGGGGVAGAEPGAERGEQGLGQDAQDDVEVDVEVDGGGQGVGAERADDLGQPLLDGHPPGVLADQRPGLDLVVVGDDDGGLVAAQAGDDELADGAGVAGQRDGGVLVDARPVVGSGPVQRHGLVVGAGQAVDVPHQGGGAHAQGGELDAAAVELAEDGLGGDLLVHDQHLRVRA